MLIFYSHRFCESRKKLFFLKALFAEENVWKFELKSENILEGKLVFIDWFDTRP